MYTQSCFSVRVDRFVSLGLGNRVSFAAVFTGDGIEPVSSRRYRQEDTSGTDPRLPGDSAPRRLLVGSGVFRDVDSEISSGADRLSAVRRDDDRSLVSRPMCAPLWQVTQDR